MGFFDDIGNIGITTNLLGLTDYSIEDQFGSLTGQDRKDALRAQQEAAASANATQLHMYNQTRADQEPWRQAGIGALGQMQNADFQRDFTMADFQADPGYQFRMSEGMKAIQNSAAAKGSLNSGATLKSLMRFGQDTANQGYTDAYNRFNSDRDRRFNRLSSLAGTGQTATNQVQGANTNYGNQVSQNQIGIGNATAAYHTGQGDMYRQYGQQAMSAFAMSDIRAKSDILKLSKSDFKEVPTYIFRYKDEKYGKGFHRGVMAQDLLAIDPNHPAVSKHADGYYRVDYSKLEGAT